MTSHDFARLVAEGFVPVKAELGDRRALVVVQERDTLDCSIVGVNLRNEAEYIAILGWAFVCEFSRRMSKIDEEMTLTQGPVGQIIGGVGHFVLTLEGRDPVEFAKAMAKEAMDA